MPASVPRLEDSAEPPGTGHGSAGLQLNRCEAALLAGVNRERSRAGLAALRIDVKLQSAARARCRRMAQTGRFVHTPGNLIENIGEGHADSSVVLRTWMASRGTRGNILDSAVRTIGVAGYVVLGGEPCWVLRFRR